MDMRSRGYIGMGLSMSRRVRAPVVNFRPHTRSDREKSELTGGGDGLWLFSRKYPFPGILELGCTVISVIHMDIELTARKQKCDP